MKKAQLGFKPIEPLHSTHSTTIAESIKLRFLAGNKVSIIDYQAELRPEVTGIIKTLQDELPIVVGWRTIRQSYLSETRTRARTYHIPEAFLREVK